MPIEEDVGYDLAFSEKMYSPESVLSDWLSLSAVITTSSFIFYNMARRGALKVHPHIAKFISIWLILLSTFYMLYSLIPYYHRMDNLANTCNKLDECSDKQTQHIILVVYAYLFSGILTSIIQLVITYLIIVTV